MLNKTAVIMVGLCIYLEIWYYCLFDPSWILSKGEFYMGGEVSMDNCEHMNTKKTFKFNCILHLSSREVTTAMIDYAAGLIEFKRYKR